MEEKKKSTERRKKKSLKAVMMQKKFNKFLTSVEIINEANSEYSSPMQVPTPNTKPSAFGKKKTFKIIKKPVEMTENNIEEENKMDNNLLNSPYLKENLVFHEDKEKNFDEMASLGSELSLLNFENSENDISFSEGSITSLQSLQFFENNVSHFNSKGEQKEFSNKEQEELTKYAVKIQAKWRGFFLRKNYLKLLKKFKVYEVLILLIQENENKTPILEIKMKKLLLRQQKLLNCIQKGEKMILKRSKKNKNLKWVKKLSFQSQ